MKREDEDRVLEWCNQIRKMYGLGDPLPALPPDATREEVLRGVSRSCPVAKATTPCGYHYLETSVTVKIPGYVTQFMKNHDARTAKMPEDTQ